MCVRCWACEKTSDEEVCNCLIIRQHDVKEDPYLAPEEKKRRLTNLEAMAETRRQQLLDNCVETIDLTTANYQPTFRTASSNPNKRTAPSASTPAVCFSPTRSVGRGRSLGPKRRKPASQQNASSSSSSPRLYAMVHWPRTSCRRWSPLPRLRRAPFSIRH